MKRKAAPSDFEDEDLPATRARQFWDIIKERWRALLLLGVWILVFSLPLIAVGVLHSVYAASLASAEQAGSLSAEDANAYATSAGFYASLLSVVGLAIASVGFAGATRVLKILAMGDGLFFKEDFLRGIKENWVRFLITFVLFGAVYVLFIIASGYEMNPWALYSMVAVSQIILFPAASLQLLLGAVYDDSYFHTWANGFILYFKTAPLTLLFSAILFAPCLLFLISDFLLKGILLVLTAVFIEPLAMLAFTLRGVAVFDRYINFTQFPEYYRAGLSKEKKS